MDKTLEYSVWIIEFVVDHRASRELSVLMAHNFPELSVIKGRYSCPLTGDYEHWWLQTADGTVIDPTADKFPSHGIGVYRPYREYQKPTGSCVICGDDAYNNKPCCSKLCMVKNAAYSIN